MSEAAEILVIIVSSILAIFLIISIILGIYLIRLSVEIRRVAKSAQSTVNNIGSTFSGFGKIISPVFVGEVIGRVLKKYTKKGSK
jgi:F0F1-type ATP synthase assembly protein I